MPDPDVTPFHAAPQHGPRPLPLFLDMLRSETAQSPERRAAALAGLAAYQAAPRPARAPPMPTIAMAGRASLRDYGGVGAPVVFVPSLINPPFVLDLAPEASLLRWLVALGHHVLMVDWGTPAPADRADTITVHIEAMLLPMLRTLPQPPVLVGYCLGGTMALAAASVTPVRGVALLAAPWHFARFDDDARAAVAALWRAAAPACEALGLVPMEVLQAGFWRLDPARTVAKFEALADADADTLARFVALEDWANAGAPLTLAAGQQLFERFFDADDPGSGRWEVAGRIASPAAIDAPTIEFVSTVDRIVPAASRAGLADHREIAAGHVGMVVGSRARTLLWEPLDDWLKALPAPR